MRRGVVLLLASLLVVPVVWAGEDGNDQAAPAATWHALPDLPRVGGVISGMGVDSGGTLWVMTNTAPEDLSWATRKLYWWDGAKWQEPKNADEMQGDLYCSLFGGGKRGLYAVHWSGGRGAKQGDPAELCKLVEGKVRVVTELTHASWLDPRLMIDAGYRPAGLYVARDGRLFAYGASFLDVYLNGKWKRLAEPKQPLGVSFLEQGELIHIVYDKFLCTVSPDGTTVTRQLDGLTDDGLGCAENAILWGDDALLVVSPPRPEPVNLHAYKIETGKPIDIEDVKMALEGKVVIDAVRAPDGSAWICPVDAIFGRFLVLPGDSAGSLRVLTTDGDVFELDELSAVSWWIKRTRSYPGSALTASEGTFWIAPNNSGVLACKDSTFICYAADAGLAEQINFLGEGADGTIYAASSRVVYARQTPHDAAGGD